MKKLLGVTVLLALVVALVPVHAFAALRGTWDPLTNGTAFQTGLANGCEQPSIRRANVSGGVERWYSFSTRSTVVGSETSRSIWLARLSAQIGFSVVDILDARRPLLVDPSAVVSYADPAWSPDGKYLAYVQTDAQLTTSAIYVQEYMTGTASATAATPVGSPLLVVPAGPGILNRSPDWKPDGTAICYVSNAAGPSLDVWYVSVDPATATVGIPARATSVDTKAEINPTWGPGNQIAYATNKFGRNVLEIVDLDDMSVRLAETNFASISHNNPSWSSDGASLYYDAPQNEDINNNTDIWKLDLASQSKCDIFLDAAGDADPDVSAVTNLTTGGEPFNFVLCSSTAAGFGLCIWRTSAVGCLPALPLGVTISPTTLNLDSNGGTVTVDLTLPPEVLALGYSAGVDQPENQINSNQAYPSTYGREGLKNRRTLIASPTFLGLTTAFSQTMFDATGGSTVYGKWENFGNDAAMHSVGTYDRKRIAARLVALGLVNQAVICPVTAYSASRGRQFQGYGIVNISASNLAGQAVRMEQNSPNPFNPVTKIRFAVAKPGFVNVRIYNVRGELVKTVASGNFGAGSHEASWDGSTRSGAKAATGVYFAKASVGDGKGGEITSDVIKMVMAK